MTVIRSEVQHLDMIFGDYVVQRDVNFTVAAGEIFVIMGGSGCGKSTLLKHMMGLLRPAGGDVLYDGESFWNAEPERQTEMTRRFGVLFQSGALWSSMTLSENVALPLEQYTKLRPAQIAALVSLKLSLVGLRGFEEFYPAEISGGMRKRAGLARALALDPSIVFFDEPSAGLDPVTARNLDELIVQIRDTFGTTIVIVSHDVDSIYGIADRIVMLDRETHGIIAEGRPAEVVANSSNPKVVDFLTRRAVRAV